MALLGNSSLQHWLYFNETSWDHVPFPPCQHVNLTIPNADEPTYNLPLPIITNASCTQVCNDSISLFGWQDNLATCGLWSSLVYAYNFDGSGADPNRYVEKAPVDLLSSFTNVGLDAADPEYFQSAVTYADAMSACFVYLYQNVKAWKMAEDGLVSGACTKNGLFPYSPVPNMSNGSVDANLNRSATALNNCLVDICSPVALNPELAGIGFVTSFIIQSFVAIVATAALLTIECLDGSKRLNETVLAFLVGFHKAQCYFSSVVQIAALNLVRESLRNTGAVLKSDEIADVNNDFVDTSALVVLATSGFIPVTFGLASIMRFGRQTWYLKMLTLITFVLATATLSTFYHYNHEYSKLNHYYSSVQDIGYIDYGTCTIGGHMGDTLFPLCGSSLLNNNAILLSAITRWWVWAAWANCMAWMLLCFFNKLVDESLHKMVRSTLDSALTPHPSIKLLCKIMGRVPGRLLIFIVTSALCFGVQFYLISIFNQHYFVSQVWSFGQIIAVMVWIPTIIEFGNSDQSGSENALEHKYPNPLGVMRFIVSQSVGMANFNALKSGSDPETDTETVLLQSLSSAENGHGIAQENQQ